MTGAARSWPSIPATARERIVERYANGAKARSTFHSEGARVGVMLWEDDGRPSWGWGLRDGRKHGRSVEWWSNGAVSFCEPHIDGLPHGVARHWDEAGRLLARMRYVRGTGVDLWCVDGRLSEETHLVAGTLHGARRQWNQDGRTLGSEEMYREGVEHGVFREWNAAGRLRRGSPRYFVRGVKVDRRAYLRAAAVDATLTWRAADDSPRRTLPPAYLGRPAARGKVRGSSTRGAR